jgi:hypothetical protein
MLPRVAIVAMPPFNQEILVAQRLGKPSGLGFVPHIRPRRMSEMVESWSEWQDLPMRPRIIDFACFFDPSPSTCVLRLCTQIKKRAKHRFGL